MEAKYRHLEVQDHAGVLRITLNRPEVHNAFNRELIDDLQAAFGRLHDSAGAVRAVVLAGAGPSFCAGADVNWMRASVDYSEAENVADALHMAHMLDSVDRCPVPVIARVHGAALGGGVGLVAACDIAIAAEGTRFAFSEAKLGIAPAVISTFVLPKIGQGNARALFFTAERFGAERALRIGLVHDVVPVGELDAAVDRLVGEIRSSAPHAITAAKRLLAAVPGLDRDQAIQLTAETIAALRTGPEGQDGLRAFLEKRKPGWVE
ncbi:MAG TPA: enoyl-CoA hydratase-related protein [Chloroflexia bacterium]|nr:enoyl-CoA hydratase-related protein [Chloroflexia bacterium]